MVFHYELAWESDGMVELVRKSMMNHCADELLKKGTLEDRGSESMGYPHLDEQQSGGGLESAGKGWLQQYPMKMKGHGFILFNLVRAVTA